MSGRKTVPLGSRKIAENNLFVQLPFPKSKQTIKVKAKPDSLFTITKI